MLRRPNAAVLADPAIEDQRKLGEILREHLTAGIDRRLALRGFRRDRDARARERAAAMEELDEPGRGVREVAIAR